MSGLASGITGAAPIWHTVMAHLLEGKKQEIPQKPPTVVTKYICDGTGQFAQASSDGSHCQSHAEYFVAGVQPKTNNFSTQKVWVDKTTGAEAPAGKTDNVEQRDETVLIDGLGNKYCLTCAHPTPPPTPTPGH
jgi:membrane carboxypeptidase/penicillin-binding protein